MRLSPLVEPTKDAPAIGTPVPVPGPGVCIRCHGPARDNSRQCWCCRRVGALLGEPAPGGPPVIALALCRPGDPLHRVLRGYKDASAVDARRHHRAVLARRIVDFLAAHQGCLWAVTGGWDALAVVPSTARQGPAHWAPLESVVAGVPLLGQAARVRLARGPGRASHLAPARDAFSVPAVAPGQRVLLMDDTWVTGSRARSAAATLQDAGARVSGIFVVGRLVDTAAAPGLSRWWDHFQSGRGSDPIGCGECGCGVVIRRAG